MTKTQYKNTNIVIHQIKLLWERYTLNDSFYFNLPCFFRLIIWMLRRQRRFQRTNNGVERNTSTIQQNDIQLMTIEKKKNLKTVQKKINLYFIR